MINSNTTLKLYQTSLQIEKNFVVDDLDTYLAGLTPVYASDNNFQRQKIALDRSIKINKPQTWTENPIFNYAVIEQDNRRYYFYVVGCNWRAQKTVAISLHMDTLNTYRSELVEGRTDKTTINRQRKNRWVKAGTTVFPQVDEYDEGLQDLARTQTLDWPVQTEDLKGYKWYLIYQATQDLDSTITRPINCYCVADHPVRFKIADAPSTITVDTLAPGIWYILGNPDGSSDEGMTIWYREVNWTTYFKEYKIELDSISVAAYTTIKITAISHNFPYQIAETKLLYAHPGPGHAPTIKDDYLSIDTSKDSITAVYGTGEQVATLQKISDVDRTDSRLIRIVELPYAPFNLIPLPNNTYALPNGWTVDNSRLKLTNVANASFENDDIMPQKIDAFTDALSVDMINFTNPSALRDDKLETKRYNSSFHIEKLAYDSFSVAMPLERLTVNPNASEEDEATHAKITFYPSADFGSNRLFKVDPPEAYTWKHITDYEQYRFCSRNNELPIFSSNYITYRRTGYNYDKKINNLGIASQVLGVIGGIGGIGSNFSSFALNMALNNPQTVNSWITGDVKKDYAYADANGYIDPNKYFDKFNIDFGDGTHSSVLSGNELYGDLLRQNQITNARAGTIRGFNIASIIGRSVSSVASIASGIINIVSSQQAYKKNLATIAAQSAQVSGANDLSLLNVYNGQTAHWVVYDILPEVRAKVKDLFYYCGYNAGGVRQKPNLNSRVDFNYVQCSPDYGPLHQIDQSIVDDATSRWNVGATVLHHVASRTAAPWDFEQKYTNYEVNL